MSQRGPWRRTDVATPDDPLTTDVDEGSREPDSEILEDQRDLDDRFRFDDICIVDEHVGPKSLSANRRFSHLRGSSRDGMDAMKRRPGIGSGQVEELDRCR